MKKICLILLLILSLSYVSGAYSVRDEGGRVLKKVVELYDNDMFEAAEREIELIRPEFGYLNLSDRISLDAYTVLCHIALGRQDMDAQVNAFEDKYGRVPELSRARVKQAEYYFHFKDYSKSLSLLEEVEYSFLSRADKENYLFYRSFSQLRVGKSTEAERGFDMLLAMKESKYLSAATYYKGYLCYLKGEFKEAIDYFSKVRNDEQYISGAGYYILESDLMLGNYEKVAEVGEAVLSSVSQEMKPKVARIVSDAFFELNKPVEAKKWFERYSSSGKDLSRKDNYYLGVISYSLKSYNGAIDAFSKVVLKEDSLSQSSLFHIANSYLNLKNKHKALDNYRRASLLDFDPGIREESYFNYAKLSFDVNSDIKPFTSYLEAYPATDRADEIYSYIATSYLLEKRYEKAVEALNRIKILSPAMELNLQKASFLRGLQQVEMGSYSGAVTSFKTSLSHSSQNTNLMLLTKFWLSEAYYRSDNFDEALKLLKGLSESSRFKSFNEYPMMLFNIGYCFFRKEDYPSAIEWFNAFCARYQSNMKLTVESKTRIADSYFMMKDYGRASVAYEEVSLLNYDAEEVLYSAYQSAVAYGLLSDNDKKIEILESIYGRRTSSPIYLDAVYELGRTYIQVKDPAKAEATFNYLLNDLNDTQYRPKVLLELGMLYSNLSDYEKALSCLEEVVEESPLSKESEDALAVVESIYLMKNRPDDYLSYLEKIGRSSDKSGDEKEMIYFNSAEQIFLAGNFPEAVKSLLSYLEKYPQGAKHSLACFYLGESYSSLGKKDSAAKYYMEVIKTGEGSFVELSTLRYAEISFEMEQYSKAFESYQSLYDIAQLENNRYEALLGMMRAGYRSEKYLSAIEAATDIQASVNLPEEYRLEAKYIMAKSYIVLGHRLEALPILKELSLHNQIPVGAEASFLLIQDAYDSGEFEEVENYVYAFSDSHTNQTYWLAKSFIVLGDSFAERGEMEQAEATFNSIKEGYVPQGKNDDVIEQVEFRLEHIKKAKAEKGTL